MTGRPAGWCDLIARFWPVDAKFYKIQMPKDVRMHSQERAYTSPIWYTPGG